MTSRWRQFLAGLGATLLAGCASLPEDQPVMEQLDTETGVTIARLGRPMEIYRETFLRQAPGRFGFLAPFETNRMGTRQLFLWLAVPVEPAANAEPTVRIDGAEVSLGPAGRTADFAGLRKSPYKIPTPWSAMFYFKVDQEIVSRLANARSIDVSIFEATQEGAARIEFAAAIEDDRLKVFASSR
jgi:hypothetical protein